MASPMPSCEAPLAFLPEKILVAVSGGVDSMTLLHVLDKSGRKPVVIHFDHGWRKESAADALWVKDHAQGKGLLCVIGKQRSPGAGTPRESQARAARYAFFEQTGRKLGIADLVLAHQADDQVETFLMQLLRGGGAAARGMEDITDLGGLILHRPWLGVWRKEILAYARREKVAWREDGSNADVRHRRNLIRHRVLPYLEKHFSRQVTQNLWRAAEVLRAESQWLDALCAEQAGKRELRVKILREVPVGQQRRTIFRWLRHHAVSGVSFAVVEAVRALIRQDGPAKTNLSEGRFVRRRGGMIFIEDKKAGLMRRPASRLTETICKAKQSG